VAVVSPCIGGRRPQETISGTILNGTAVDTRTMLAWYEREAVSDEATFLFTAIDWASIVGAMLAFHILHNKQR
jgi:hypothetical protein